MHPTLLDLGSVRIPTHDAFSMLALIVGLAIYYRELRRRGWLEPTIVWISVAAVLGAAIGARAITSWEHLEIYAAFADRPFTEVIERSGKSILGGIAGGYLAIVLAKRAFDYRRSTGDLYALAIPVATVIGRIGCFLTELPLGTPTSLPWAIAIDPFGPMHPSMLYEIGFNLIAITVIVRYRYLVPVQGDTLKAYLLAAGIFRFLVEFVRGNEVQVFGLTGPQMVLMPLVGLLVAHFVRQLRVGVYHMPAAPRPTTIAT